MFKIADNSAAATGNRVSVNQLELEDVRYIGLYGAIQLRQRISDALCRDACRLLNQYCILVIDACLYFVTIDIVRTYAW